MATRKVRVAALGAEAALERLVEELRYCGIDDAAEIPAAAADCAAIRQELDDKLASGGIVTVLCTREAPIHMDRLTGICREAGWRLLPGQLTERYVLAGPLLEPEAGWGWPEVRRLLAPEVWEPFEDGLAGPKQAVPAWLNRQSCMDLLASILAASCAEALKAGGKTALNPRLYVMDRERCLGRWLPVFPDVRIEAAVPEDAEKHPALQVEEDSWELPLSEKWRREGGPGMRDSLNDWFTALASPVCGLFREWGEEALPQLPLAQCAVRPIDPCSPESARPLELQIIGGFTREEARKAAALTGLERFIERRQGGVSERGMAIGVGESPSEALYRGVANWLRAAYAVRLKASGPPYEWQAADSAAALRDERCAALWRFLELLGARPKAVAADWMGGYPAAWLRLSEKQESCVWTTAIGLDWTIALRGALEQAVLWAQNGREDVKDRLTLTLPAESVDIVPGPEPCGQLANASCSGCAGAEFSAMAQEGRGGFGFNAAPRLLKGSPESCRLFVCEVEGPRAKLEAEEEGNA